MPHFRTRLAPQDEATGARAVIELQYGRSAGPWLACDDSDFIASARAGQHRDHRGPRPDPMFPMIPMPCSCGPASKSLHPIFQQPLGASARSYRRACARELAPAAPRYVGEPPSLGIDQDAHRRSEGYAIMGR